MKAIKQTIGGLIVGCVLALGLPINSRAQLLFTDVRATVERAIQLRWQSQSNAVYQIQYADEISDQISWNILYDDYPSHGTNTFWLDTGNYFHEPAILHPRKMPMRFYRIVAEGTNTLSPPTISISSPTNGASVLGDLTVTISASTTQPVLHVKLYVDGEEMPASDDGTNFVINTCEWPSGSHILFATAKCESDFAGRSFDAPYIIAGRAVSSYKQVTFANLITRLSFSEPFFDPDAGQTQRVSAVFAAGVDWTLQIQNASTNTVRFASGSGAAMQFDWDGTGTNGVSLPAGIYTYLLTAQTNGQTYSQSESSGGGDSAALSSSGSSSSSAASESSSEDWYPTSAEEALMAGLTSYFVESAPMPPVEIDGKWYSWEQVYGQVPPIEVQIPVSAQESFLQSLTGESDSSSFDGPQDYSGASSQSTRGPVRPPTAPVNKVAGTFGVAYQRYLPASISVVNPLNGILQQHVAIQGHTGSTPVTYTNLPQYESQANGFIANMKKGAWRPGFTKTDTQLQPSNLKGTGTIFNQVNLGLLMVHGVYGTSPDYTSGANGCEQMYFPIQTSASGGEYVRMSEMNFGSTGTNGLKWMAIFACNSLKEDKWNSMQSAGVTPFNSNLHLLLGTDTVVYTHDSISALWARAILGLSYPTPRKIRQAWYDEARGAYGSASYPNTMNLSVAGWEDCWEDTLQNNSSPGGAIQYETVQVYP
jgi:hypothetical protein